MRKYIPKWIKKILKWMYDFSKVSTDFARRRFKKISKKISGEKFDCSYSFVILCVKNPAYTTLAINNINSLHFQNPTHHVTIHCDNICYSVLKRKEWLLDYPEQVDIQNTYSDATKPWQLYKIESLIIASHNGQILTDADGIWHADPVIDPQKIIFQVYARRMEEDVAEYALMTKLFGKEEWLPFSHYVTGFVSWPEKYMTENVIQDMTKTTETILEDSLDFLNEDQKNSTRRLSEELAVNIVAQKNFTKEIISTLKTKDPKGDKNILQSLYYGCSNNVIQ